MVFSLAVATTAGARVSGISKATAPSASVSPTVSPATVTAAPLTGSPPDVTRAVAVVPGNGATSDGDTATARSSTG